MSYPQNVGKKWQKHLFIHKMLLGNTRITKTCTWTNFGVEHSFMISIWWNPQILVPYCDVIFLNLGKKGKNFVFLHEMLLDNTRKTKTYTWTNFRVENSFPVLVFRILENLTTCCDVISPKYKQKRAKHGFLHKMMLRNNKITTTCTWTNFGVENSFMISIWWNSQILVPYCDVTNPK